MFIYTFLELNSYNVAKIVRSKKCITWNLYVQCTYYHYEYKIKVLLCDII